jgi:hypothetical protein
MSDIVVRLDRVQIRSWAPSGQKPPALEGFKVTRDSFVRRQTSIKTYARCRHLRSLRNDTKIYWQYERQKSWLKPWKITIVADDRAGLSYDDIENVLQHCKFYNFLIVELAVDFNPAIVDEHFVRQHALFGKSRRVHLKTDHVLYWGGRKSLKFVRCYKKENLGCYRVEVELHSQLLKGGQILTLDDFEGVPNAIYPRHFQFVDVDWSRLKQHLLRKCVGDRLVVEARQRLSSLSRLRRYLRRQGVVNFHRFLVPLAINERIDRALTRWIRNFEGVA